MIERIKNKLVSAAISNDDKYKLAAGIVHKKRLISIGINSKKTHPLMGEPSYHEEQLYLHAEVDSILRAIRYFGGHEKLKECDLYVVRVKTMDNRFVEALAKPCCGCQDLINRMEIRNVYWTE